MSSNSSSRKRKVLHPSNAPSPRSSSHTSPTPANRTKRIRGGVDSPSTESGDGSPTQDNKSVSSEGCRTSSNLSSIANQSVTSPNSADDRSVSCGSPPAALHVPFQHKSPPFPSSETETNVAAIGSNNSSVLSEGSSDYSGQHSEEATESYGSQKDLDVSSSCLPNQASNDKTNQTALRDQKKGLASLQREVEDNQATRQESLAVQLNFATANTRMEGRNQSTAACNVLTAVLPKATPKCTQIKSNLEQTTKDDLAALHDNAQMPECGALPNPITDMVLFQPATNVFRDATLAQARTQ